jgi:putative MATE family efflux protein
MEWETKNTRSEGYETFLTGPVGRLIFKTAGPAVISLLVMTFYQIVDGIMVGRRLGPDALAAVNILYPLIALFVGLAVMLGTGGNARIAVLLGSKNTDTARRVLSLLVVLGIILGILGTALVLSFSRPLIRLLGAEESIQEQALTYLFAMCPFFAAYILSFILEQSVRNDEKAGFATGVMAAAAGLNILLDYLFLFVFDMGISGAALASGIAMMFSSLAFLGYFILKTIKASTGLRLAPPLWSFSLLKTISGNGSSELFSALALGVVTLLFNRALMNHLGPLGVAAFAMVQYILLFSSVFFVGISTGIQPILSQNYGAGCVERVKTTLLLSLVVTGIIATVLLILIRFFTAPLAGLFVTGHPEAVRLTRDAMNSVGWSIIFAPAGTLGSMFFTSIEKARPSLVIALTRSLVLPLAGLNFLPAIFGSSGIWLVPLATEATSTVLALFLILQWKRRERNTVRPYLLKQAA